MRTILVCLSFLWLCGEFSFGQKVDREWLNEETWPAIVHNVPIEIAESDDPIQKLQKERVNACLDELRARYIYWLQGQGTLVSVCENANRLIASRVDMGLTPDEELELQKGRLAFAKRVMQQADAIRTARGTTASHIDEKYARYYRLDAELAVAQLQKNLTDQ